MPRTKGSKNRPKTNITNDYAFQITEKQEIIASLNTEIASITANIDTLKADLKEKKNTLKKAEKEVASLEAKKAKADAKAAEEAKKAEETARSIFTGGDAQNMPSAVISKESFKDGNIDIISIVHQAGLASSRSEARRAVEQGGVSVADAKVTDIKTTYSADSFGADGLVVKRGKKKFVKVLVK